MYDSNDLAVHATSRQSEQLFLLFGTRCPYEALRIHNEHNCHNPITVDEGINICTGPHQPLLWEEANVITEALP
jgi:hypothetical protein